MGRKSFTLGRFLYLPGLIVILTIVLGGLFKSLLISFGYFKEIGMTEFTFEYYKKVLTDKTFIDSILFTLKFSFISSFLAVIIGAILAYSIFFFDKTREFYLNIPVIIPHMLVVVFLLNFLSNTGLVSRILFLIGIIEEPTQMIQLFYNKNSIGIILVYILKGAPFAGLVILQILKSMSINKFYAARNLGAGVLAEIKYIIWPDIKNSMTKIFLILFSFSFSSYEVPFLIGPTKPRALAVKSYIDFTKNDFMYKPTAMVINIIIGLIGILSVLLILRMEDRDSESFF